MSNRWKINRLYHRKAGKMVLIEAPKNDIDMAFRYNKGAVVEKYLIRLKCSDDGSEPLAALR